jgi:integrase/recombinase XerD
MKKSRVLNDDEFKRLCILVQSGKYGVRDLCIVHFSFLLGMRVKEISNILVRDVLNQDGTIKDSFYLEPEQTKGNDGKHVYMSNPKLRKSLLIYLDWRQQKDITSTKLFWNQKGGSFTPKTLQMWFQRMYQKNGFEGCSSHSGRRTFITKLIHKGYDIHSVKTLVNHKNIQTTCLYVESNPLMLSDMVKGL